MSELSNKFDNYFSGKVREYPKGGTAIEVAEEYKTPEQKVKESIARKRSVLNAVRGTNTDVIKRTGAKYYNQGITDILAAERKTRNLLTVATDDVEDFIEDEIQKCIKSFRGTVWAVAPEEQQRAKAEEMVQAYIIRGSGNSDRERKAHEKYQELIAEVGRCNTEYNSVLLAKQNFINENADLIAEAQREKRLRDLKKAGILEELGLTEKSKEETKADIEKSGLLEEAE